jgi:hypothetical protein
VSTLAVAAAFDVELDEGFLERSLDGSDFFLA